MSFFTSSQVSATLLGEPDVGLLTTPEIARKAGQISAAVPNVCVIADADTGKPPSPEVTAVQSFPFPPHLYQCAEAILCAA